ncbi:hypothetical protein ACVRC0_005024, partial [Escherichia coli]
MNILKKLMQRLCGCGKHDGREHGQSLTAQAVIIFIWRVNNAACSISNTPLGSLLNESAKLRHQTPGMWLVENEGAKFRINVLT